MNNRILTVLILFLWTITQIDAWWDEGHLLVAGIANLQLTDDEIESLESLLRQWDIYYPGLSNIVTASVWPDHIKCEFQTPYCKGLRSFDALEVFDQWHYVSQIFNPQSLKLGCPLSQLPFPSTGAIWALSTLLEGIPHLSEGSRFNYSIAVPRPNRHKANLALLPISPFSWNFRLRLLLHIFGDLHQPLHAIETFSRQFPEGDLGGNSILVDVSNSRLIPNNEFLQNFHHLWDSCGGQYTRSWPGLEKHEVLAKARDLVSQYPKSYFGPELEKSSFKDIANDSYRVAIDVVYEELNLDWNSDRPFGNLPLQLSEQYVEKVQRVCKERIVLGGYRLSYLLKDLARAMRSMESNEASYKKTRGSFPLPVSTFPIKRETASRDFVSGKLAQKEEIVSSKSAVANFPSKSYHSGNTLWYCMLAIVVLCGISVISCLNWIVLSRQLSLIRSKTWLNNEAAIHHMSFNRSKHLDLLQQSLICHESEN